MSDLYNASVNIRDLPRMIDHKLNMLATARQKLKWEIIREALVEYVENHKGEI